MNELKIMTIEGIECYEENGIAYLNLEACARGLGLTTVAASGNEVVRWNTVHKYLSDLGVATSCNGSNYRECCPGYIPENIFYRLAMKAMKSKKAKKVKKVKNAAAEAFLAKIVDKVIPFIREHGTYMTEDTIEKILDDPDTIIRLAASLKEEREKRRMLEAKAVADRPKVIFTNSVTAPKNSILVGELAKLLKQNGVKIGQNRLFETLREKGFLIKKQGADYNMPTQRAMELGLFEIKETVINHSDGHTSVSKTPKVTGKGQQYFVNLFLGENG